jgi:hypothetical protein
VSSPPFIYGFQTPRDLLEKLKRDGDRLWSDVTPDNLFNYVVTAWSLIDWIKNGPAVGDPVLESARKMLLDDPYLQVCRDLTNHSKHFTLRYSPSVTGVASVGGYGTVPYGSAGYGQGTYAIQAGADTYYVHDLIGEVLLLYETFFATYGL